MWSRRFVPIARRRSSQTAAWMFGWSTIVTGTRLRRSPSGCETAVHTCRHHQGNGREPLCGCTRRNGASALRSGGRSPHRLPERCRGGRKFAQCVLGLQGSGRVTAASRHVAERASCASRWCWGRGDYASLALGGRASAPVSFTFRAGSFEQPVYAGDVVDAIIALLERTDAPELVELAGPERVTRRELTRRAGPRAGSPHIADIVANRAGPHVGGGVRAPVRQPAHDESHARRAGP